MSSRTPLPTRPRSPDGGWGWVVVACSFLALVLGYGSPQSIGILYPEWLQVFREGKALTSWVGSVVVGGGLLVGPVCSVFVVDFGVRSATVLSGVMVAGGLMLSAFAPSVPVLIFTYGIVVGVGDGLLYAAIVTITCQYFERRRGLALGMVSTGLSAGGVLYAWLQRTLVDLLGLDGCLLLVGALALNVVACAGLMRPLAPPTYHPGLHNAVPEGAPQDQELSHRKPTAKDLVVTMEAVERRSLFSCSVTKMKMKMSRCSRCLSCMLTLLQDRVLLALCISLFLFSFGSFPPLLFLEDLARSSGLMEEGVTSLVTMASIGGGVGKLGLGVAADVPRLDGVLLYAGTVALSGLAVLLLPFSSSYLDLQVLAVVLGFLSGNWTLTPYVTSRLVGVEKLAEAHGVLMFFGGAGLMLGPPAVGCFYDFMASYDLAFYLSGGCMMAGSLILVLAAVLPRTQTPPPPPETELIGCMVTEATDTTSPISDPKVFF